MEHIRPSYPERKEWSNTSAQNAEISDQFVALFTKLFQEYTGLFESLTIFVMSHSSVKAEYTRKKIILYLMSLAWPSWLQVSGLLSCWKRNDAFS